MDTPVPPPVKPPTSEEELAKKYIRTFEGDMEVLKRGGRPDLKPVDATPEPKAAEPRSAPQVTAAAAPQPTPLPPPPMRVEPAPAPPPPPPRIEIEPTPPPIWQQPVVRPTPTPEPRPVMVPEVSASPLQTYTNDFLERVKETRASKATILATEADAGNLKTAVPETPRWKTVLSIIGGVVLLSIGAAGVYVGYNKYLVKIAPVILAPTIPAPIFVDVTEAVTASSPAALLSSIQQAVAESLPLNSVRLVYADSATTTGNDLFSRLQFPAPGVLLRNINSAGSMVGVVNVAGTPSAFFILSVASYPETFAGMLSWEATMPRDLAPLFPQLTPTPTPTPVPVIPVVPVVATTTSTTTPTKAKSVKGVKKLVTTLATSTPPAPPPPPPPAPTFHDETISNHDVRVYRDSEGRSVFVYGYWDKKTLVIARDVVAFTEILHRLANSSTP